MIERRHRDIEELNDHQGRLIVAALVKNGVRTFLIAPGSRCTPLVVAAAEHEEVKTIVHFDERGIAYHGLGIAKASQDVVAIICTSGTAVANLYPAIVEASMDHVPLLFLCADRPFELRDCGANQTIDQVKMFGSYLRFASDLPCPDGFIEDSAIITTIDQACYRASKNFPGPVVLNCMFREPLSSYKSNPTPLKLPFHTHYYNPIKMISKQDLESLAQNLSKQKGVILAGNMPYSKELSSILLLAEKLQWPVIADPLSHLRSFGEQPCLIKHYNYFLNSITSTPDIIIHFGGQIVSKTVNNWIRTLPIKQYLHVANFPTRHDPHHQVTDRIEMEPSLFSSSLPIQQNHDKTHLSEYQYLSSQVAEVIKEEFLHEKTLVEALPLFSLMQESHEDLLFFFGNSLAIRYADSFFFPNKISGAIYGNRGVSGIDGNIATIAGIAEGSKKHVVAIIGDFTFLHDLNSLALLKNPDLTVTLIVLNNQGGGIFKLLPVAESPHLDRFFVAKHTFTMEAFVRGFNLSYNCINSVEECKEILTKRVHQKGVAIIEICCDSEQNELFLENLKNKATSCTAFAKNP